MTHDEMAKGSPRSAGETPTLRGVTEEITRGEAFMDRYDETFCALAK